MRKISLILLVTILFGNLFFVSAQATEPVVYDLKAPAVVNGGNPTGAGFSWTGEYAYSWGMGTQLCSQVSTTTANFSVSIAQSGRYAISMNAAAANARYSVLLDGVELVSGTWDTGGDKDDCFQKEQITTAVIPAGNHVISVVCNTLDSSRLSILYLNSLELVLGGTALGVDSITMGGVDLLQADAKAPVSADVINVKFAGAVFAGDITAENIRLLQDGGAVPAQLGVNGDTVTIALKSSLVLGATYTLNLENIYDSDRALSIEPLQLSFTTQASTAKTASLQVAESGLSGGVVNVAGTVQSSQGLGLSGRKVMLYAADNQSVILAETISGENGAYTLQYQVPAGSEIVSYQFVVEAEYAVQTCNFSVIYVNPEFETTFLQQFSQTTTIAEVREALENPLHEQALGIDVSEDLAGISDTDSVFSGLVGFSAGSLQALLQRYTARIGMVTLAEADASAVKTLLLDENFCEKFALDYAKLSDVLDMDSLAQAISALTIQQDEAVYYTALNRLLNGALLTQYGKADTTVAVADVTTYCGRSVRMPLALADEQTEVKKVSLLIGTDAALLSTISFRATNATATLTPVTNGVLLEILPANATVRELGTLLMEASVAGSYPITVSGTVTYEKALAYSLQSVVQEREAEVFVSAETPPDVIVYYEDGMEISEEVDTYMPDTTPAVGLIGNEYVRFPVSLPQSGEYEIYLICTGTGSNNSARVEIGAAPTPTVAIPSVASNPEDISSYEEYYIRTETLGKGTHYVKVSNAGDSVAVRGIKLLKTADAVCYDLYAPTIYYVPENATVGGTYWVYYEAGTDIVGGTTVSFRANVEQTGFYDLYLTASSDAEGEDILVSVNQKQFPVNWSTETHMDYQKRLVGKLGLVAGDATIKVSCLGTDAAVLLVNQLKLMLRSTDLRLESVTAQTADVLADEKAPASTDVITLTASDTLSTELPEGSIVLREGATEIPLAVSVAERTITAMLKSTLKPNTAYTLTIKNIKDIDGICTMAEQVIAFETDDTANATATVTAQESSFDYGTVNVSGVVSSSQGVGIAGRQVWLAKADAPETVLASAVSQENGAYTLSYQMPADSTVGLHTFLVLTQYSNTSYRFNGVYVTPAAEQAFFADFDTKQTAVDVKTFLELSENEELLSIDVSEDITGISDADSVFSGLIQTGINTVSALREKYYRRIAMLKLSEATDALAAEALLTDAAMVDALGLSSEKLADITTGKTAFYTEVAAMAAQNDDVSYAQALSQLVNQYVLAEYSKADCEILASNVNAYVNQSVNLPLTAENALTQVKEANLTISVTGIAPTAMQYLAPTGVTAETTVQDGKLLVRLVPQDGNLHALGSLQLASTQATAISLTISGVVTYTPELEYELASRLTDKTVSITVTENVAIGGFGGGITGGGGGGGGSLGGIQAPKPETAAYAFTDLQNAPWAEEAVAYLLQKNVLSKPQDQLFRPEDPVTREEFVKMVVVAFGIYDASATSSLSDVAADAWYTPYIGSAVQNGLVMGNDRGGFGVGENITRQDISVMIARALARAGFDITAYDNAVFADHDQIGEYAEDAVYFMRKLGIVNGVGDNQFAPRAFATRAQAAKMIYGMMKAVGK